MANGIVTLDVEAYRTEKQERLLRMLNDPNVRTVVNTYIRDAMQTYVPKKTGALRRSSKVTPTTISWGDGLKYAHYQWYGEVYGPNYPITRGGHIVGWYSKPGVPKRPTGRKLGAPGQYKNWVFGYTTPETMDHWNTMYYGQLRTATNGKINAYLRKECSKRGLSGIGKAFSAVRGFFK